MANTHSYQWWDTAGKERWRIPPPPRKPDPWLNPVLSSGGKGRDLLYQFVCWSLALPLENSFFFFKFPSSFLVICEVDTENYVLQRRGKQLVPIWGSRVALGVNVKPTTGFYKPNLWHLCQCKPLKNSTGLFAFSQYHMKATTTKDSPVIDTKLVFSPPSLAGFCGRPIFPSIQGELPWGHLTHDRRIKPPHPSDVRQATWPETVLPVWLISGSTI